MLSGVYIGQSSQGSYDLVSTGDYINPISPVFKLKDTRHSIHQTIPLHLIINDIDIEMIKLEIIGVMSMVKVFLSWDQQKWTTSIIKDEVIDAISTLTTVPFYMRTVVDDFLEYFELSGSNAYKQHKIRLSYI